MAASLERAGARLPAGVLRGAALLATPLGRLFNGSTVTLDGARDNWFGPWPPAGLGDDSGVVPTEERRPAGG